METTNGVPSVPSNYYLYDTSGNPICNWPGNPPDYILNITNPTVAQFVGQYAAQVLQNNPQYNGVFFDNVGLTISQKTKDCYGNLVAISTQDNGIADDPAVLNNAWAAGLFTVLSTFRQLAPNAYAVIHGSQVPTDPRTIGAVDGDTFAFNIATIREGTSAFGSQWDAYNNWFAAKPNALVTIQSSPPTQVAYGYGFTPAATALPQTVNFAQSFYPNMRFGLGMTLMNNGYSEFDFGDNDSWVAWWYDEYNFNLGQPVAPAQHLGVPASSSVLTNGSFENGLTSWKFGVGAGAASAAVDTSTAVDGTASAHVNVTASAGASYLICLEQDGLSVVAGQEYQVKFWAKADTQLPIQLVLQGTGPSYTKYGLSTTVSALTGWNQYSLSFIATQTASDGRLEFNLGSAVGNIWIDNVTFTVPEQRLYRRDFQNGVVLLNGTNTPQTFPLEAGLTRFTGSQAPRYQYIVDDSTAAFSATGSSWAVNTYDTGWRKQNGPYYHAWNSTLHEMDSGTGSAQWNLQPPADGQYTLQAWLPAAPNSNTWTTAAVYQISQGGTVLGTVTLNQSTASQGDQWFNLGTFNLTASKNPIVTVQNGGSGPLIADAVYVFSASDRYNDGAAVSSVTLQPMDAILLSRQTPTQSITFPAPGSQIIGTPAYLNATASSGLTVSYTANTPAICQLSGAVAQPLALGTCSITATQPGGSGFTAAVPVTVTFQVFNGQSISMSSLPPLVLGSPAQAVVASASSGLPVALVNSPSSVCSLSGTSVGGVNPGVCTITATQSGNSVYAPASPVSISFPVVGPQTITFPAIPMQALGGLPVTPGATASSGLAVAYSSGTPSVCTTAGSTVALVGIGTCSITALQSGNSVWAPAPPVTQSFTVVPNLLINGGFEGTLTPWRLNDFGDGYGTLSLSTSQFVDGASSANVDVTQKASYSNHVNVEQDNVSLIGGASYRLQFWAIADSSHPMDVLADGGPSYPSYGLQANATVGTTWQLYTMNFTATQTTATARLEFHFGLGTGNVWMDDVQLFGTAGMPQSITWAQPSNVTYGTSPLSMSATASSGLSVIYSSNSPAVCTVSGAQVAVIAAGTCSVKATQPGNSIYLAAQPVTRTFQVATASQTISFPAISNVTWGVAPFFVPATASSGLVVTLSSSTPSVCSASNNTITAIAAGTCVIAADQTGNANYMAAPEVVQSFLVVPEPQTVTFTSIPTQGLGGLPLTVNASASSGLGVVLSSNSSAVCTVSASTVTLLTAGTCSLTAAQPGNANVMAAAPVSQSFTVVPNLLTNSGFESGSLSPWMFGSASPAVATGAIDNTVASGGVYSAKINVTTAGSSVTQVALYQSSLSVVAGASYTISFWATSSVARSIQLDVIGGSPMGNLGVSSYVNIGTSWSQYSVTFTATASATNGRLEFHFGNAASTVWLDNVQFYGTSGLPQSITWAQPPNVVYATAPLTMGATSSSALQVLYSSNSPSICSVSGSQVTMLAGGTCSLTATQPGNSVYLAAPAVTQTFQIATASQTITFPAIANATWGVSPFAAPATADSGLAVTLTSNTPSVCGVSGSTVTAMSAGTCSITASQAGNADYAAATPVTQSFQIAMASQTISFPAIANVTWGVSPFSVPATADSGLAVTLTSNTPAVCSTSGNSITAITGGTCSLTATQAGNVDYSAATSVTQSFQIATASQTITFPAIANVTWGVSPFSVPASASSGLVVTLTSNTSGVCSVSGNTVTAGSAGTCSITATQAGNVDYTAAAPVTQSFSVLQQTQTVTFGPIATQGLGGLPFTVSASSSLGLTVQLTSNSTTVCTVSGSTVTLLTTGTCSLTASQPGNTNVAAAVPVTQTFNVVANLLTNGGFDTGALTPWISGVTSPAVATVGIDNTVSVAGGYSAKINVTTAGTNVSQVVLYQNSLSLTAGKTYVVSFWANSSVARSIQMDAIGGSPLVNIGFNTYMNLGTGWNFYTLTFTSSTTVTNGRLEFHFGNAVGTVWLDNVQLFQQN